MDGVNHQDGTISTTQPLEPSLPVVYKPTQSALLPVFTPQLLFRNFVLSSQISSKMRNLFAIALLVLSANAAFVCNDKHRKMHVCCESYTPAKPKKGKPQTMNGNKCKHRLLTLRRCDLPSESYYKGVISWH